MTTWRWSLAWSAAGAALVEVKQISGPFDALGRPAVAATWRFMIYQTGQIFASVEWPRAGNDAEGGGIGLPPPPAEPVSLVLMLEESALSPTGAPPEKLLRAIYPEAFRKGVLPHELQLGNPVAMVAKTGKSAENLWWRADVMHGDVGYRIFGVGLPAALRKGPIACTLLASAPTLLDEATAFSQYLLPPTLEVHAGRLDQTFPGDLDNDGLVDLYGFYAIRLENLRASVTLNPGDRPAFYPTFLFTLPPQQQAGMDMSAYRVILNIDGQQITDPPRWPDGSFLVQLPWIINKPVRIEAGFLRQRRSSAGRDSPPAGRMREVDDVMDRLELVLLPGRARGDHRGDHGPDVSGPLGLPDRGGRRESDSDFRSGARRASHARVRLARSVRRDPGRRCRSRRRRERSCWWWRRTRTRRSGAGRDTGREEEGINRQRFAGAGVRPARAPHAGWSWPELSRYLSITA